MGAIVADEEATARGPGPGLAWMLLAFLPIAYAVFGPGLSAPFISDDYLYIVNNPYVREFDISALRSLLDPTGDAIHLAGGNYAPIHGLAHAAEWSLFGEDVRGYHLVNVVLHCGNAVLLAALLLAAGVDRSWSLVASALFLVHPANVESVVWISQLKSLLGLGFALTALLCFRNRPMLAGLPFVLALCSKAMAAFALPFAAAMAWSLYRSGIDVRRHVRSLAVWVLALALLAIPQLAATASLGGDFVPAYPDLASQLRSIFAIGARYLAMAGLAYGTAAYHEPAPAAITDGWWWAGLCAALLLSARLVFTLRRGREEAAWWLGAVAAFAPVSQWIPFYFSLADRYLYFILPGLIGGVLLLAASFRAPARPVRWPIRIAAIACVALLGLRFASISMIRSEMWNSDHRLLVDSARRYPAGATANFVRALAAMQTGDRDAAIEQLRLAADRDFHFVRSFQAEPLFAPLADDPRFEALVREIARRQIEVIEKREIRSQRSVIGLAQAYFLLGEHDHAIELLESSAREAGPLHDRVLLDLVHLRRKRAELKRGDRPE